MIETKKYILDKAQYLSSYEKVLLLRRFEEKCGQLYGMGLIGGFCHLYIGQEAIITGIDLIKIPGDNIITSYRDHAHIILSGTPPREVLAELTGKATGCSKGKGGSMHLFNVEGNFYGGHGIVGAQVPIGTGLAFSLKYKKSNNISFTFLGDGALNQGQVYEAFNMAGLWKLPVVYIIENNGYAMGTPVKRSTSMTALYKKGEAFNIPGFEVNGMDLEEVYSVTKQAVDYVRAGNGPIILEMKCYRYRGHSMSDPARYRSKEEVEGYKLMDPLLIIREKILENNYTTESELKTIEAKVKNIINEAVEFAENSLLPDINELYTDVYSKN